MKLSNAELILFACPKCGLITISSNDCKYCGTQLQKTDTTIGDLLTGNINKFLKDISKKFYKKTNYDKQAWKDREKRNLEIILKYRRMIAETCLKRPMRACPKCCFITPYYYFEDNNICPFCQTEYIDTNVSGFNYYYYYGTDDVYNQQKNEKAIKKICSQSDLYDSNAWEMRSNNEALIQPLPEKNFNLEQPHFGIIPSLLVMPLKTKDANDRLSNIMQQYVTKVQNYIKNDNLTICGQKDETIIEILTLTNYTQIIFQSQRFLGQSNAINFCMLFMNDLIEHIKETSDFEIIN